MQVDRKALTTAVNAVCQSVEKRATLPILEHIFFYPKDGALTLVSTNLEFCINQTVPATGATDGPSVGVSAGAFSTFIKRLPKAVKTITLELERNDNEARILVNGAKIAGLPDTDFPPVNKIEGEPNYVPGLMDAIEQAAPAMSNDEARYALCGLLVTDKEVVTTDGHRLYRSLFPQPWTRPDIKQQTILPRGAVKALLSSAIRKQTTDVMILDDKGGPGRTIGSNATIMLAQGFLTTRLVEGQFPSYESVTPQATSATRILRAKKEVLAEAIATAATMADARNRPVKLSFMPDGTVTIAASSMDVGEYSAVIPGATYENLNPDAWKQGHGIGFNGNYLLCALESMDGDEAVLEFKDTLSPLTMRTSRFTAVIMPMRI